MEIIYLGHSSFRLKGRTVTVVTDPYSQESTGLKFPKNIEANIVTLSHAHDDHNQASLIEGSPKVISGPGEYEIAGVSIFGTSSHHDNKHGEERGANTIYTMTIDGVNVCHLGDLGHKLTDEQLSSIGNIDLLFVPVGGVYTIDSGEANEVVTEIEPKIVIPMHYFVEGLKYDLRPVEDFVKETGLEPTRDNKFSITADKIPEEMQLVILERKS